MAPEVMMVLDNAKNSYDARCDVWSIGVMAYVMLIGKFPVQDENIQRLKNLLKAWNPDPKTQNDLNPYTRAFNDPIFLDLE